MSPARTTPLFDRHVALGGRLIEFAGWRMPVYYTGITDEHRAVRARAGLFDVSHMGQLEVTGEEAKAWLQRRLSNDLDRLKRSQAQYTLLTNADGGIDDDLIAYRLETDRWLLVVNASNVAADVERLRAGAPAGVEVVDRSPEHGMLALQGPAAMEVLATAWGKGNPPLDGLAPFEVMEADVGGVRCLVASTGYTGEPGVEVITPWRETVRVWDELLHAREHGIVPCGLGARDTLRLEVGYPLHGNDIGPDTNAVEAGLAWACALEKDFTGRDALRRTAAAGPERRLVALRMLDRAIPRAGYRILEPDGGPAGAVTSGTLSPSLDRGIAMGYVRSALAEPGTPLQVEVRGRTFGAEVVQKPIYRKEP